MGRLIEKATGKVWTIPDEDFPEAVASGLYEIPEGETVTVVDDTTGLAGDVNAREATNYMDAYEARPESAEEFRAREDEVRKNREHGGIAGGVSTVLEGAANSATLGAYDFVGGQVFGDEFRTRRKEQKDVNSGLDMLGEGLGYLTPTGLAKAPGLIGKAAKYSPIGLAERAGQKIAARGLEKSAIKQIGYAGLGLGVEGAAVGLGESLSEYGLATSDLEREQAIGNVSSNVLFGAATGGALGAGAKGAGLALKKGKKIAQEMTEAAAEKRAIAELSDDVANLDIEGVRAARAAEQEKISEQIFENATGYQGLAREVNPMLAASAKEKRTLISLRRRIDGALANPKGFKKSPGAKIEDALQREEVAYRKILDDSDALMGRLSREDQALVKKLDEIEDGVLTGKLASRYGDLTGTKITKQMSEVGVEVGEDALADLRHALDNGQLVGARKKALDRIPELIEANLAQQEAITALKTGATPRLTELRIAEDALTSGAKAGKGTAQKIGEGAVLSGVTGALGAMGVPWTAAAVVGASVSEKLSSLIFGKLGKAAKNTAAKTSGYVGALLDASAKVGQAAPPLATKVLAGVRFGEEDKTDRSFHKSDLAKAFKARESEIYAQITMGPKGPTMKPAARQAVADQLAGVRLANPQLADSMETMFNRRLAFLARKLPKRPDYMKDSVGPDTWAPPTEEIRGWARYVAAAEDPSGVEERLADGTLTPEDVEAYREVYPERYLDIKQQIATRLPELQATLPIVKRMALSLFTDLDVEPSLNPIIFDRLQAQYGEEPGTEGGSQAPVPQPSFGAFGTNRSADKLKTPAQQRT